MRWVLAALLAATPATYFLDYPGVTTVQFFVGLSLGVVAILALGWYGVKALWKITLAAILGQL